MGDGKGSKGLGRGHCGTPEEIEGTAAQGHAGRVSEAVAKTPSLGVIESERGIIHADGRGAGQGAGTVKHGGAAVEQEGAGRTAGGDEVERARTSSDHGNLAGETAGVTPLSVILINRELTSGRGAGDHAAGTRRARIGQQAGNLLYRAAEVEDGGRAAHDEELSGLKRITAAGERERAAGDREVTGEGRTARARQAGLADGRGQGQGARAVLDQAGGTADHGADLERRSRIDMEHALRGAESEHRYGQRMAGGAGGEHAGGGQGQGVERSAGDGLSGDSRESQGVDGLAGRQGLGRHGHVGVDGIRRTCRIDIRGVGSVVARESSDAVCPVGGEA